MSGGRASKAKGSQFERDVCKRLSLWISQGKEVDLFWRSAMSGGRASLLLKQNTQANRAAGDITATHPSAHIFTDRYFVECKFYRDLDILPFLLDLKRGRLWMFWKAAQRAAAAYGKLPMLIAKQNMLDPFVVARERDLRDQPYDEQWPCAPIVTVGDTDDAVSLYWFEALCDVPRVKPTLSQHRPHPLPIRRPHAAP